MRDGRRSFQNYADRLACAFRATLRRDSTVVTFYPPARDGMAIAAEGHFICPALLEAQRSEALG